jgi:hypothetical protein
MAGLYINGARRDACLTERSTHLARLNGATCLSI